MRRYLASGLLAVAALLPVQASAADSACRVDPPVAGLGVALEAVAERRRAGRPLTIVLLGSAMPDTWDGSAEKGGAASLREALARRWPDATIHVKARSLPGYRASDMLEDAASSLEPLEPALILWQAGGAAAAHDTGIDRLRDDLAAGVERLRETGADVTLVDLPYVRRWEEHPRHKAYLSAIRAVAGEEQVGLFRRYDVMKQIMKRNAFSALQATGAEGSPPPDPSRCLGLALADAIVEAEAVAGTRAGH